MPLAMCKVGTSVVVRSFLKVQNQNKLNEMGIVRGVKLQVVSAEIYGPMVVELFGSRLALGHDIVSNILVETLQSA